MFRRVRRDTRGGAGTPRDGEAFRATFGEPGSWSHTSSWRQRKRCVRGGERREISKTPQIRDPMNYSTHSRRRALQRTRTTTADGGKLCREVDGQVAPTLRNSNVDIRFSNE